MVWYTVYTVVSPKPNRSDIKSFERELELEQGPVSSLCLCLGNLEARGGSLQLRSDEVMSYYYCRLSLLLLLL